ncbi:MAG: hypothetical protein AAGC95_09115 [Pseudomonadota bacterium]
MRFPPGRHTLNDGNYGALAFKLAKALLKPDFKTYVLLRTAKQY